MEEEVVVGVMGDDAAGAGPTGEVDSARTSRNVFRNSCELKSVSLSCSSALLTTFASA